MNEVNAHDIAARAGLASVLRKRTAEAHRAAERSPLMASLLRGEVDRAGYAMFLGCLEPVYIHLEEALQRHASHPALARIHFPQIERRHAVRADLECLGMVEPMAPERLPGGARAYVARVRELTAEQPELLIAHAYTRYLGDLSGGQVLARQLQRALGLTEAGGLSFFAFPNVENIEAFKHAYRIALDRIPIAPETVDEVADEACRAFEFNRRLADDVWDEMQRRRSFTEA